LGLQNPVVQVLHGDFDYYYQLSVLHRENINKFICVSSVIEKKLNKLIAEYFDKIFYQRFPIQNFQSLPKDSSVLRCAYFVRDLNDPRKCFKLLPQIEKELQKKSVFIEWHIAGGGMDQEQFEKFWEGAYTSRINFWGELNREGVNKLLQHCNVMVLPSLAEGFPVAVVEGMKCGLIPLVSKWDGAINDLVQEGFNGFYFNYQDAVAYANCLEQLAHDPEQLSILGVNAKQKATFLFDPRQNTRAYEMHFLQVAQTRQESKVRFKSYGSRLDEPWMPNFIAKSFR
jgi:glycosyltransferase involved in cell wall biosynthesis